MHSSTAMLAVCALLLAACVEGGRESARTDGSPTASPAGTAAGDSHASHTPRATALETPDLATADCQDGTGDPTDPEGTPPPSVPAGMDLTMVHLIEHHREVGGSQLGVQYDTEPPVPPTTDEPSGLFWSVEVWMDAETGYQLRAALDGADWTIEVFDYAARTMTPVDTDAVVADRTLFIAYPLDVMPAYARPLRWFAATEWGDADRYNDACPGGSDPVVAQEDQLTFP